MYGEAEGIRVTISLLGKEHPIKECIFVFFFFLKSLQR